MLDHFHIPTATGNSEVFYFEGACESQGQSWITWNKPRGKSMIDILLVGKGGAGGNGAVGANSAAAGGGGGGSGGQSRLRMPLHFLPDTLFLSLASGSSPLNPPSYIAIAPVSGGAPNAINALLSANSGGTGGNAAGATAGTAGTAGPASSATLATLGGAFATFLAGQTGTAGGTTSQGSNLTLPVTGLLVTGGTGGSGLGIAGSGGSLGGSFIVAGAFPAHSGGAAQNSPTAPANYGANGYRPIPGLMYGYGGTGGGATHGTATGAGLVGANGGNGAPGCGGGGGGGALTGSTQGLGGNGGPAFCLITCW